uniref:Uncharacterized protein n=1 Tax=Arundo donax TaxID=35708 RepID=A0A0A8Y5H3_ARUDO
MNSRAARWPLRAVAPEQRESGGPAYRRNRSVLQHGGGTRRPRLSSPPLLPYCSYARARGGLLLRQRQLLIDGAGEPPPRVYTVRGSTGGGRDVHLHGLLGEDGVDHDARLLVVRPAPSPSEAHDMRSSEESSEVAMVGCCCAFLLLCEGKGRERVRG